MVFILSLPGYTVQKAIPRPLVSFEDQVKALYHDLSITNINLPDTLLFEQSLRGFFNLKEKGQLKKNRLTIIDFRLPSSEKRMWVIDVDLRELLYHNLVAHGKNTGELYARAFSNRSKSNQSSMGFYVTGRTYMGRNGLSLYLNGMEPGFNDQARNRAIVMHGAKYVSESFVKTYGRLGRSFGCPAVPVELHKEIIETLKEGTCLFIYYPDKTYLEKSTLLNATPII